MTQGIENQDTKKKIINPKLDSRTKEAFISAQTPR
jgi:hypothetical protein